MNDWTIVDRAHNPQTGCTECGNQTGPYAYGARFRDEAGNGIYYCERCATCVTAPFNPPSKAEVARLVGVIDELTGTIDRLEGELEVERQDKSVPLADVIDFFEEKAKRRPEKTVA